MKEKVRKIKEKTSRVTVKKFKDIEQEFKKGYNPMYYYPNKLFSYDPKKYWYYICIGSRGRGKTVSAWRWVLKRFLKHAEMFVWLRLTDAPIKKMAANSSSTMVPQFLLRQLGIESIFMKGATVFINVIEEGIQVTKMVGIMDSISTFYTTKGNDMSSFDNVVFDEINREKAERNTFEVARSFINQIESIARFRKIRVLMLGNTIDDASDILSIFNFQPKEFGIYKLTRRNTIVEYLDDSEEFKAQRKNSLAGMLLKDDSDVAVSFVNRVTKSVENTEKWNDKYKQLFIFYVDTYRAYGVYERRGATKGDKGASEGLYIGTVRNQDTPKYKISPFMTSEGLYMHEIYKNFLELIAVNKIWYETTLIRSRFIKALKTNRTSL